MNSASAGAGNSSHLNTYVLTTAIVQLNIACYNDQIDTGGDTEITGWTVSSSYFIKVYAPYDLVSEVNSRQRHTGVAGTGYRINPSGEIVNGVIYVQEQYTVIEGIEIYDFGTINDAGIEVSTTADYCTIDSNIIHDDGGTTVRGINAATNVDYTIIINNLTILVWIVDRKIMKIMEVLGGQGLIIILILMDWHREVILFIINWLLISLLILVVGLKTFI
jgi:hypothetical protein